MKFVPLNQKIRAAEDTVAALAGQILSISDLKAKPSPMPAGNIDDCDYKDQWRPPPTGSEVASPRGSPPSSRKALLMYAKVIVSTTAFFCLLTPRGGVISIYMYILKQPIFKVRGKWRIDTPFEVD